VHDFLSARKSPVCTDKNIACYLSRTAITSHNQLQQAKAGTAQKFRQVLYKVRRKAGYFRVNIGKVQSLQMPAFSLTLYSKPLTLYCKRLTLADFSAPQQLAIF